jgi:hypothetical protein
MSNLRCYIGSFGSGKSLAMLEDGLKLANDTEKKIVSNFPLSHKWVIEYAQKNNLKWLARCCRLKYVNVREKGISAIFIPDSIILFDELGIYLDAQKWELRKNDSYSEVIPTLRHHNIHLLCTFQYLEQVDKKVRENCQMFVMCKGATLAYDKNLKAPKLLTRCQFYLPRDKFWEFERDPSIMSGGFKLWIRSLKVFYKIVWLDWLVFEIKNLFRCFLWFYDFYKFKKFKKFIRLESNHVLLFNCYSSVQDYGGAANKTKNHCIYPVIWNADIDKSIILMQTRKRKKA